jgi:hypothetical protein
MKTFEQILNEAVEEEVYRLNDKAPAQEIKMMCEDLRNQSLRALARLAIRASKEVNDE